MKQVKCAVCGKAHVHGTLTELLQSTRFPTVFLHNGECRQRVWSVLVMREGFDPRIPLIQELTRDDDIHQMLRHEGKESQNASPST